MDDARTSFESGATSHVGLIRRCNEDGYLVQPQFGVWAVADGMGGHDRGEIASATVIHSLQSIGSAVSAPDLLARFEDRVSRANKYLQQLARERAGAVIGTTVAALLAHDTVYACIWSGDSRIYLVRGGAIQQVSRDHTEARELVEAGQLSEEAARTWPRRNVITRAVGVHDEPELELEQGELKPGDVFVLCSDGLTAHVSDREILDHALRERPQMACDSLVALALQRGGTDNVTVVAVRYSPAGDGDAISGGALP
jgi:serine/threonine protein phosphatase PrpC